MDASTGKPKRNENESNRKRQKCDLRFSSSCTGEKHQILLNETFEQNEAPPSTTLYDLPLEMLDIILQKSCLHWILNSSTNQRDEEVIRSLISVDICFYRRIIRQRFKKAIWCYLNDFYGKTKKRYAIIRNNIDYLLEYIQPNDELIASLLSLDCITEEQSHFIQRQRSKRDKNDELLYVVKSFDETKFSNFVKYLRLTNQKTVSRIMENGGGVIKIQVQNCGAKCTTSMETKLLQKIEDLRNRTKPRSHLTDKLISQLREEGIEILNSQLDRQTVVVWIWCHSQAALEHIQKLYKLNQLRDVFLENIQSSIRKVINIDMEQFKKTVVVCPISINFTQRIDAEIRGNEFVYGVTKLRNEIYVLWLSDPSPNVIRVFEDRNPFVLQKKIEINQIKSPADIESSEKENCLYVSDYKKCVWKITRETDDQHKIIKWLTTYDQPHTLSVSSDGQLLVVNGSSSNLMIYGSNAELIRSILLPRDIEEPIHAVVTSFGNFIVIHRWMDMEKGESGSSGKERVMKWGISELTSDGHVVIRRFIPLNDTQELNRSYYISLDSDDRVFVSDYGNGRVILLNSDLKWNRILCPTNEETGEMKIQDPYRLCYDEEKKQLIVGGYSYLGYGVNVYNISRK